MKVHSKSLEDGQTEITILLSQDDLIRIASQEAGAEGASMQLAGLFDSTRYCVTCTLTEKKFDIDVPWGDIGANIKATALCGPGLYRYHDGPC